MTVWAVVITGLVMIFTAADWRRGLLAVLAIGVLQDVFRKLTYGAPAYFILWSTLVYAFVVLVAYFQRAVPSPLSQLSLRAGNIKFVLVAFLLLVLLQCINALLRYSSPAVAILGGLFYFGPFLAMLIAIAFVDSERRLRQFLIAYLVVFIPTCLTVFLSPVFSMYFPVLRDVGTFMGSELVIYDMGTKLASYPGILRVGELAAWHAATCIAFLGILTLLSKNASSRVFNAFLMVLMVGVIVLTGRRKMLAATTIFFALQWGLLLWYRFGIRKMGVVFISLSIAIGATLFVYEPSEQQSHYLQRSKTVYESISDRLDLTWSLVQSAITRSEIIGLGAGVASQGARFVGVDSKAMGAAESGFGKIVVELGPLGFVLLSVLLVLIVLEVLGRLDRIRALDSRLLVYQVSFIAFLTANLAAFAIASQLFGDLFVLIILGTVAGFVIRIHNLAADHSLSVEVSVPVLNPGRQEV